MLRIFLASDFHGSDIVFRKFVNAGNHYKADALFFAGDMTGKALNLVVKKGDTYEAEILGERIIAKGEVELKQLLTMMANRGYYYKVINEGEIESIANNRSELNKMLLEEMTARIEKWMDLATYTLRGTHIKMFLMTGNDDPLKISDTINQYFNDYIVNINEHTFQLNEKIEGFGIPYANKTPWKLPGDLTEEALESKINALVNKLRDPSNSIFVIHVPPINTIIDQAPELKDMRVKVDITGVRQTNVGSTAVRKVIEEYQPLASFHGHIHEARGVAKIGRTYCFNPGSEYEQGILRGTIVNIDLDSKSANFKIKSYMFTYG